VKCLGCNTHQTVALDIVRRPKTTPVHELERYMRCKDCSQVRLVALRATKITASDPPSNVVAGRTVMPVKEGRWKDACAVVGELVLLYTSLDHQLNHIIIEVMHLAPSPLLETVVATLDPRQKIEMLKSRAGHLRQPDWKKAIKTHADRLDRVAKIRNAACHTPMIPSKKGEGFEFAPAAASKLLKSMTVRSKDDYAVDRLTMVQMHEAVGLAEKALARGEDILMNFAKVRSALTAKASTGP
jgi:hypothetical protein